MRDKVEKPIEPPTETLERSQVNLEPGDELRVPASSAVKLRLIWDARRTLFRWTAYGFALSTLVAFLIPKRYEATARLMPPDQSSSGLAMLAAAASGRGGSGSMSGGLGTGLGSIASDLLGMKSSGALFVGILQSSTVQDDLINKFNLRKVYWDRYMEDARKDLGEKTDVSEDRKSGIVTIRVTDRNPERAAALAKEYVSELNRVVVLLDTSAAHREREFLEDRLTKVNRDLESAENNFSDFASKNTALDIPAQGKAMIEATAALEGQLIGAQTQLEGLRRIFADGNVRVRSTQARVDELRRQLEKLGGRFDETDQTNSQDSDALYPSIKKLPVLGVKYADLYRSTRVQEAIFETLTQEYELARVEEAKEIPSVKVLDSPDVPEKKSYPPRLLIVVLGTMFALSIGAVLVFGKALWAEIESTNPHKALAMEISEATKAHLWRGARNGSGNGHSNGRFWNRSSEKRTNVDDRG